MKSAIETTLVLSTAHMPETQPDFGALRVAKHEYGYIIFLCSSSPSWQDPHSIERAPAWLRPAIRLANSLECNYINFDRDAGIADGIPIFDW